MLTTAQRLLVAGFLSFPGASASADFLPSGTHSIKLIHEDRERSAMVYVPSAAVSKRALPVVLNLHGGGGHAANQQGYSNLDALAERENFLAVYPNGTGRLSGRLLTWNAGTCCGYAAIQKIDDVGFVRALVEKLADMAPVDRRRIYAAGLSNGGMMAHRLGAEVSDLIAAVAPVAGGMVLREIKLRRAVPVLHMHSIDDPRAPYDGRARSAVPHDQRTSGSPECGSDASALGHA